MIKNNNIKKFALGLFIIMLSYLVISSASNTQEFVISIDSEILKLQKTDGEPFLRNQRTMVPIRVISEDMGYDVSWNAKERKVTIKDKDTTVTLKEGESHAFRNGKKINIDIRDGVAVDTKALIKGGRTYVPLRFVAEAFNAHVRHNKVGRVHNIYIYSPIDGVKEDSKGKEPEGWIEPVLKVFFHYESNAFGIDFINLDDYNGKAVYSTWLDEPYDSKYMKYSMESGFQPGKILDIDRSKKSGWYMNETGPVKKIISLPTAAPYMFKYKDYNKLYEEPKKGEVIPVNFQITYLGYTKTYKFPVTIK